MQEISCILKFTQFVVLTALPLTNSLYLVAACRNKSGEGGNCVLKLIGLYVICISTYSYFWLMLPMNQKIISTMDWMETPRKTPNQLAMSTRI